MKTRNFYRIPIVILLASLMPVWAYSAEEPPPWYQVEVILFSYNDADLSREKWPDEPGTPNLKKFVEILDANELAPENGFIDQALKLLTPETVSLVPRPYTVLNKEQLTLTREAQIIRRSSSRKLLLHMGWIQPALAREKAPEIYIRTGKEYTISKPMFTQPREMSNKSLSPPGEKTITPPAISIPATDITRGYPDQNSTTATSTPVLPTVDAIIIATAHEVEGTIQVSISRYLHVKTDLMYHQPGVHPSTTDPSKTEMTIKAYRFQDHRRMRSKELHYLDNPAFGVLIQIVPYDLPKTETREKTGQP